VRQHERVHVIEANDQTPFFILALVGVSSPPFEHYVRGGGELALHTLCIESSRGTSKSFFGKPQIWE